MRGFCSGPGGELFVDADVFQQQLQTDEKNINLFTLTLTIQWIRDISYKSGAAGSRKSGRENFCKKLSGSLTKFLSGIKLFTAHAT